jgi:hypothetical protein
MRTEKLLYACSDVKVVGPGANRQQKGMHNGTFKLQHQQESKNRTEIAVSLTWGSNPQP